VPARVLFVACLLLALSTPAPGGASDASVDDLVLHQSMGGVPFEEAHRLGPRALPRLAAILADEKQKPYWANATAAIGAIGGATASRHLRTFIWHRFSGPVDQATYDALTGAVSVLGFTCGQEDRSLVALLEAHADPNAWRDLKWSYGTKEVRTRALLSKLSLQDLGFCGSPAALEALLRLKRAARGDRLEVIEGAIRTHKEVARSGIVAYMARRRQ
jgi:hypothetical protein